MESIIKNISAIGTKMSVKEKNILMRLKQIHQDYKREYNQYKVNILPIIGCYKK